MKIEKTEVWITCEEPLAKNAGHSKVYGHIDRGDEEWETT